MSTRIPNFKTQRRVKVIAGTSIVLVEDDVNAFLATLNEAVASEAEIHVNTAVGPSGFLFSIVVAYEVPE